MKPQVTGLIGSVGSGKTREVLRQVAASLRAGRRVALVCFNYTEAWAIARLRERLELTPGELQRLTAHQMSTLSFGRELREALAGRSVEEVYVDAPHTIAMLWPEALRALRAQYANDPRPPAFFLTVQTPRTRERELPEGLLEAVDHVVRVGAGTPEVLKGSYAQSS